MRKYIGWLAVVVVVAAIVGGIYEYSTWSSAKNVPRYETRKVTRGDVQENVLTTGTVQPLLTVAIGSQVSGIVEKLYVDFNATVHKGQIIALMDSKPIKSQIQQAQADLDNAMAGVTNQAANLQNQMSNLKSADSAVLTADSAVQTARVGILNAQAQFDSLQAGLEKAQAQVAADKLTYGRNLNLRKRDMIAESDLDQARTAYLESVSSVNAARAQLEGARAGKQTAQVALQSAITGVQAAQEKREAAASQVEAARSQVSAAQATVKRAQAALDQQNTQLEYCTIRSPVEGIVISRNVDQGNTVAATYQAPQLYTLGTDLKHMQVLASVDEADISRVYDKQKATFTVDGYPNDTFDGVVRQVREASTTTNNVVTYQVVVDVENPDLKLRPGMTANVNLLVRDRKKVLLVPNIALRYKPDDAGAPSSSPSAAPSASPKKKPHVKKNGPDLPDATGHQKVWILQDNKPTAVDIDTGITDTTNTEILKGLAEGQEVITGGGPTSSESPRKSLF